MFCSLLLLFVILTRLVSLKWTVHVILSEPLFKKRNNECCFLNLYLNKNSLSYTVSRDQYTALPLEEVLVLWYGRISYICTFWYNFDTVLCQFLETGTKDECLIGIVQLLRFSGFSLYPLSFFLNSPFKHDYAQVFLKKKQQY